MASCVLSCQYLVSSVKRICSACVFDNFCRVFDFPSTFLQLIPHAGGDLTHFLQENTSSLSWPRCLQWLLEITKGLEYLHSCNIVHRDVKSDNCLLTAEWHCKLTDFGLSRVMNPNNETMTLTQLRGTPGYWAPELTGVCAYTAAADIYSAGIVLWEVLQTLQTGQWTRPFSEYSWWQPGVSPLAGMGAIIGGQRPTLARESPRPIVLLYDAMVKGHPDERPPIQKLIEEMQRLELDCKTWGSLNVPSCITGELPRRRRHGSRSPRVSLMAASSSAGASLSLGGPAPVPIGRAKSFTPSLETVPSAASLSLVTATTTQKSDSERSENAELGPRVSGGGSWRRPRSVVEITEDGPSLDFVLNNSQERNARKSTSSRTRSLRSKDRGSRFEENNGQAEEEQAKRTRIQQLQLHHQQDTEKRRKEEEPKGSREREEKQKDEKELGLLPGASKRRSGRKSEERSSGRSSGGEGSEGADGVRRKGSIFFRKKSSRKDKPLQQQQQQPEMLSESSSRRSRKSNDLTLGEDSDSKKQKKPDLLITGGGEEEEKKEDEEDEGVRARPNLLRRFTSGSRRSPQEKEKERREGEAGESGEKDKEKDKEKDEEQEQNRLSRSRLSFRRLTGSSRSSLNDSKEKKEKLEEDLHSRQSDSEGEGEKLRRRHSRSRSFSYSFVSFLL